MWILFCYHSCLCVELRTHSKLCCLAFKEINTERWYPQRYTHSRKKKDTHSRLLFRLNEKEKEPHISITSPSSVCYSANQLHCLAVVDFFLFASCCFYSLRLLNMWEKHETQKEYTTLTKKQLHDVLGYNIYTSDENHFYPHSSKWISSERVSQWERKSEVYVGMMRRAWKRNI